MKKLLIINTLIMTMASLLIRSIGMGFNAWLSGRIGAGGVGLFQLIMSVYSLAVVLSVAGMRMAATRLSSEAIAIGSGPRSVISGCLRVSGCLGMLALLLLFTLSDVAARLLGNMEAVFPLRVLSFALPFVAMSASLAGYFTARRRVGLYGIVQLIEQIARIGMTIFVLRVLPTDDEHAIFAVAVGIVIAEAISFTISFVFCLADMHRARFEHGDAGVYRKIAAIAAPEAVGAWLRSALNTCEQLLVPKQLERASPTGDALATYGFIQGMAMPIISLPIAPMTAMAGMLVPEIAQMRICGQNTRIRGVVLRALKWSVLYSCAVMVALLFLAGPLAEGIYHNAQAAVYIRALAPLIPLLYTDSVTDHLLKSLNHQVYCMRLNTVDCVLRLLIVLAILPHGGTAAYIALIYLSEALNFVFSLRKLLAVIASGSCDDGGVKSRNIKKIFA